MGNEMVHVSCAVNLEILMVLDLTGSAVSDNGLDLLATTIAQAQVCTHVLQLIAQHTSEITQAQNCCGHAGSPFCWMQR